jgi:type 1 glutamine amidotransferase
MARTFAVTPLLFAAFASIAIGPNLAQAAHHKADQHAEPAFGRALMLTHSAGYEHRVVKRKGEQLALAERQLKQAAAGQYAIDATKDCGAINADNLENYDAVIFYTSGNLPIDQAGRKALFNFVKNGGAFVGIHSATDTLYNSKIYGRMIGGYFDGHPWNEKVGVKVHAPTHPCTGHLPEKFEFADEIYQFRDLKLDQINVLMSLDGEVTDLTRGKRDDDQYPLAWTRDFGQGRVFYSALGHRGSVWKDERFLDHLLSGLRWAAKDAGVGAEPTDNATVLFDGRSFSQWQRHGGGAVRWKLLKDQNAAQVKGGSIVTKKKFADHRLHVEFAPNDKPGPAGGQGQGNSGVYLQGRYEVQVLDSYGVKDPGNNQVGGIYSVKAADHHVARPPETWQAYDILFHAAKFKNGKKVKPARMTVYHNGVLIHDKVKVPRTTTAAPFKETADPAPLYLQDHGNPVRYRNIWVAPLASE